jgi:hypothetical protein
VLRIANRVLHCQKFSPASRKGASERNAINVLVTVSTMGTIFCIHSCYARKGSRERSIQGRKDPVANRTRRTVASNHHVPSCADRVLNLGGGLLFLKPPIPSRRGNLKSCPRILSVLPFWPGSTWRCSCSVQRNAGVLVLSTRSTSAIPFCSNGFHT